MLPKAIFTLILALAALCAPLASARDVAIGVFAFQGEQAALSDWSPMVAYLNKTLPGNRFRLLNYDAEGLREAIAAHRVDLVVTNPGHYVAMEAEFGLSRIATLVGPRTTAAHAVGSVVFARAQRTELNTLGDLKGKTLAAVAPEAFGGYLIAAREMLRQGIDPDADLGRIEFLGLPMHRVIEAVQEGAVDAGVVRACQLETWARQHGQGMEAFRVFAARRAVAQEARAVWETAFPCALSTPLYPDWPIAVTRQTDGALAKEVARALLAMPEQEGGASWSVPADYQPVHDLYRELKVGPYAYLREITPAGLARRFWPWLLALALGLLVWIVHAIRVEQLVHRRTAELRESLLARDKAEAGMRESQEQMEHLSRLSVLGELSGNLAHELNQPLTTIGTYARSVLRRRASGSLTLDAVDEACGEIAREAERAGGIVQRIRHFAKKRTAERKETDLEKLAEEARSLILGMLAQPPAVVIENRAAGRCRVFADGPQIQQVLLNLIKNAIDAVREAPGHRQSIALIIESAENWAYVHVVDRGVGLPAAQLPHLFEPFFTTKADGLGLGLPICKTIVEAHGGRLSAEPNADGIGLRFSFSLPRHEPSA